MIHIHFRRSTVGHPQINKLTTLEDFAKAVQIGNGKGPCAKWEAVIPPPFVEAWHSALKMLSGSTPAATELDKVVQQLLHPRNLR